MASSPEPDTAGTWTRVRVHVEKWVLEQGSPAPCALVVACTWLTEDSLKCCSGHRDPCGMRIYPGGLAQGVVLACGCSAARAGPCGDPSAPTASRDTRRFQIAKRVARQLARGTGRSYRRSGVCPCVPVWVSIIWCPVRTRKHTRPRRCIPRVGACIPPSLCTPRPPSAETQIGLRLLGSIVGAGVISPRS